MGCRFVGLVLAHGVVVLMVAEFSAIGRIFVEPVPCDRCNDPTLVACEYGEVQLTSLRFVVVRPVKLTSLKAMRSVDGSGSLPNC